MNHPYGQAILLSGKATANLVDIHNVITQAPYAGTCYLNIKPPFATAYIRHAITSGSDGQYQFYVLISHPGYGSGNWAWNVEVPGGLTGAASDSFFMVDDSFIENTPMAP